MGLSRISIAALGALCLALPAFADIPPPEDPAPVGPVDYPVTSESELNAAVALIDACFLRVANDGGATKPDDCIGAVALQCASVLGTGGPYMHTMCSGEGVKAWEIFMARLLPSIAEHLGADRYAKVEAGQKAWLDWREVRCGFWRDNASDAEWGKFLEGQCRLEETGRRALEMREMMADSF